MNASVQKPHFSHGALAFRTAQNDAATERGTDGVPTLADPDLRASLVPAGPLEPHWVEVIESATD